MEVQLFWTITGVTSGIVALILGWVIHIERRLSKLDALYQIFWKIIEEKVVDVLKSPTHIQKDILLDKFKNRTIELDEMEELKNILDHEQHLKKNTNNKLGYIMVMARLEQLILSRRKKWKQ